jgi:MFS family permease
MTTAPRKRSAFANIFIVSSGNFLEMYDFMVFGYYAKAIGKTFFPTGNEFASLMLALMTFGAGFLMRPVGALVLGAYIDRNGRRKGLLLTLALMGAGTLAIALMPGYAKIGVLAPVLILLSRLVQGLSAGVEVGGVSVYLSEIATPGRRGFYVAWQSASQQVAVMFAAFVGLMLHSFLTPAQVTGDGWRIPFLIGSLMVPFLFVIRRLLEESPAFDASQPRPSLGALYRSIANNLSVVLAGMFTAVMTTVFFYMITAYTPTYGNSVLHLSAVGAMLVTLCVGATNFVLLPVMGAVSDRIGRRPLLIGAALAAIVTGYPALWWLVSEPSVARLLTVELWLALVYATYNGAMIVHLTEIMPQQVRTTGFSLSYSCATAIFGGFTPAFATWLIAKTGDRAIPGAWLSLAAAVSLAAVLLTRKEKAR